MQASARRDEGQDAGGAQPVPPPQLPLGSAPRGTGPCHILGWHWGVRGPRGQGRAYRVSWGGKGALKAGLGRLIIYLEPNTLGVWVLPFAASQPSASEAPAREGAAAGETGMPLDPARTPSQSGSLILQLPSVLAEQFRAPQ